MINEKDIKAVIDFDLPEFEGDKKIPDHIHLYEEIINSDNISEDLEQTHIMYSYCVFLAEEFLFRAKILEADLDKWAGEKWRKLKSSTKRKYTDNDAKRKIESHKYYAKTKKDIAKFEKLYKQLAFGGGKALDMKAQGLKTRVNMALRTGEGFGIRDENKDEKVKNKIKNRL